MIDGINTWAVGVVRYSAGIVDWIMEEIANMDRRTRKILEMNGCLHTRRNVARLYLPRKDGGRGLIGIEDCVRRESKSLHGYLRESTEWMLQAALKEKVIVEEDSLQDYARRRKDEKVKNSVRIIGICEVIPRVRSPFFNVAAPILNRYLNTVLSSRPNSFCWRHRGFRNPPVSPYLRDGVHLNTLGQYSLYCSYRWAILIKGYRHVFSSFHYESLNARY